jgi:nucleotidyltransferase substrate binding protein (TIGR01987 family)
MAMKDTNPDIRWKQRFQNFEKSYRLLEDTLCIKNPSDAERAGLIQFFEMTFELAWKLMQDYLREQGFTVNSPKEAIKQAFQSELVTDGHGWIDALNDRNLTTHTYQEETALKVEQKIRDDYFPLLKTLYEQFKGKR